MIKKSTRKYIHLDEITEADLLNTRICDLPIHVEDTWLEACVDQLHQELHQKHLLFKPDCYLADEWMTPVGETCIGIPFYLAHPVLIQLEKKFMVQAEGETKKWCMKLLRHEAGHAISYAFRLNRRSTYKRTFGPSNVDYGDSYKYRPYSKNYVRHLDGFYAQYHPDEDFGETFAVWMTPDVDWEKKYCGWPALEKLKYVDLIMKSIRGKEQVMKSNQKEWRLSTLRMTLKNYYKRKRLEKAEEIPDFHDVFLKKIFDEPTKNTKNIKKASDVIQKYSKNVVTHVSKFSGERKYVINDLLKDIHKRGRELKLVAPIDDAAAALSLSAYVSTLVMNYSYTGKFRGEKNK